MCVCAHALQLILFRFSNRKTFLHSPHSTVLVLSVNLDTFETGNEFLRIQKINHNKAFHSRTGSLGPVESGTQTNISASAPVWLRKREDLQVSFNPVSKATTWPELPFRFPLK